MKSSVSAVCIALLTLAPGTALADDATRCLQVVFAKTGQNCNSPRSLEVRLRNTCNQPINAQLCLETSRRTATCGSASTMTPGDSSLYQYTCESTGRYHIWGCTKEPGRHSGNCGGNWNGKAFPSR